MKLVITKSSLLLCSLLLSANTSAAWWQDALEDVVESSVVNSDQSGQSSTNSEHSLVDLNSAFKQALSMGAGSVVEQLSASDGFNKDQAIHIPLPEQLKSAKKLLATVGMDNLADDLELKLNRAAEAATPQAKALFLQSIKDLDFADIKKIYEGPEDSATQYFKSKMSLPLGEKMKPIINKSLIEVGAIQAYDQFVGEYSTLPFVPDIKANLTDYVVKNGIEGIFHYMALEEAQIRKDPIKQTTSILKQVFGQ